MLIYHTDCAASQVRSPYAKAIEHGFLNLGYRV